MQSLLYLTEEADCQRRLGKLGPALKKYLAIKKVYFYMISTRRVSKSPSRCLTTSTTINMTSIPIQLDGSLLVLTKGKRLRFPYETVTYSRQHGYMGRSSIRASCVCKSSFRSEPCTYAKIRGNFSNFDGQIVKKP